MEEEIQKSKEIKSLKAQLYFFIILSLLSIGLCSYLFYQIINYKHDIKVVALEKKSVTEEKQYMISKLEKLQEEYDILGEQNEELGNLFKREKEKITALLNEIKNLNGNVDVYKTKVRDLEKRLEDYLTQIEELKTKNKNLTTENIKYKSAIDSTNQKYTVISKVNEDLVNRITAGSLIRAYDLVAEPLRIRGAGVEIPTKKSKKTSKIKICFLLSENLIATSGKKDLYVRIAEPDGNIIIEAEDNEHTFNYNNKKIYYSIKKQFEYNNKSLDMCVYFSSPKTYKVGTYSVDLFLDGNAIGSTEFKLE
ncbi:MAG: hypothetical protein PHD97_05270 [Bacteroidales bacterium]|nr:hypothetical protein [Bacteroidales bacterium]